MIKTIVTEVIDGDTFKVAEPIKLIKGQGMSIVEFAIPNDKIRPAGYDAPEKGSKEYETAKEKLKKLILNKEVEIKKFLNYSFDRLVCEVYFEGKNLADYFTEYQ